MATIVTRETTQTDGTSPKGSPLTNAEVDTNFINLNDDKVEVSGAIIFEAKAAEALSKGDVVYVSGVSGNTPEVSKADANDASKMPAYGLAEADASLNAAVNVVTFGTLYDLNTSSFAAGDTVYVSTTAGAITTTAPTGESSLLQNIGTVIRSHASAGSIKVGGAGRTNATPNLNDGNVFIGNASDQAEARALTGDDISGGTITSFASTGIDDNATSTAITIDSSQNTTFAGTITSGDVIISEGTPLLRIQDTDGTNQYTNFTNINGNTYFGSRNDTDDGNILIGGYGGNSFTEFARWSDAGHFTQKNNLIVQGTFTSLGIDDNATSTAITIDSGGDLGVGETNPARRLHVKDTAQNIARFESTSTTRGVISLLDANTTDDSSVGVGAVANDLVLYSGNLSEGLRLDSFGNVGIGTASPDQLLDVGDHTAAGNRSIRISQRTATGAQTYGGLEFFFDNSAGTTGVNAAIKYAAGPLRNDGELTFHTGSAGTILERLRIDHDGNVGIGTTDPVSTAKLSISDASNAAISIDNTSGRAYELISTSTGLFGLLDRDAVSYRMVVDSSGTTILGNTTKGSGSPSLYVEATGNYTVDYDTGVTGIHIACNNGIEQNGAYGGSISFGRIGSNSDDQSAAIALVQCDGDQDQTGLAFFYHSNNTRTVDLVEGMRLDNDGRLHLYSGAIDLTDQEDPSLPVTIESTGTLGGGGAGYDSSIENNGQLQLNADSVLITDNSTVASGFPTAWNLINNGFSWGKGSSTIMSVDGTDSVYEASAEHSFTIGGTEELRITNTETSVFGTSGDIFTLVDTNLTASASNIGNVRIAWDDSAGTRVAYIGTVNTSDFFILNGYGSVKITYGGSTKLTTINEGINVTGSIGVNTTPSRSLHVNSGSTLVTSLFQSTGASSYIDFANSTTAQSRSRIGAEGTDTLVFKTEGAERLRILAGGGLTFNGDTAAANALDDYEEGTWTPAVNSGTLGSAVGHYTKIGRQVFIQAYLLDWSDYTSNTDISITGLPFTSGSNSNSTGSVMYRNVSNTAIAQLTPYISDGVSNIRLYISKNAGQGWELLEYDMFDAGLGDMYLSISYFV